MNDPISTQPGAPFAGGFYGGRIRIAEAEGETTSKWLDAYTDVPGARSTFDSMANTAAMAEAGSPAGHWARGLAIGGHTDWCVPARDVLELGYRLLKPTADENSCSFRDGDNASSVPPGFRMSPTTRHRPQRQCFRPMAPRHSSPSGTGAARSTPPTTPSARTSTTATRATTARSSRPEFAPSA